jgi:hypothetical protein
VKRDRPYLLHIIDAIDSIANTLDMRMGSQSYQFKSSIRSRLQGILTFERILPCPSW